MLEKLVFTGAKLGDHMNIGMQPADAKTWFGAAPPDLTLVARVRGTDWLYGYLRSFYEDPARPWGVNNKVFPNVGMPNVLVGLQGRQVVDRKRVVWGKSVSVRVDLGGRSLIKKKKQNNEAEHSQKAQTPETQ